MRLETERLIITEFTPDMARAVHENSLDEDTRRFVPDEVFETEEEAAETVEFLMSCYGGDEGPFVYPLITKEDNLNIGYVQLVPVDDGNWEIGYHVAKKYTGRGYATEAVKAFLPYVAKENNVSEVYGICLCENVASIRVLNKCGFELVFEGAGNYQGENRAIFKSVWKADRNIDADKYVEDPDLGYILNLRKIVGNRPLIMAGAGVFVVNDKGEILLEKRTDNGLWDYPAGSMELGESFEECARREVLEETGLKCGKLEFFMTVSGKEFYYVYPNGDQAYYCGVKFICRDYEGELKPQASEVAELKFFSVDDLPREMKPSCVDMFKKVSEYIRDNS